MLYEYAYNRIYIQAAATCAFACVYIVFFLSSLAVACMFMCESRTFGCVGRVG